MDRVRGPDAYAASSSPAASRNAFSLIAQAFFVWNRDLATYFRETLSV